jgi:hypothetical protein
MSGRSTTLWRGQWRGRRAVRGAPAARPHDIATGCTVRHALRRLLDGERYDRLVVAARTAHTDGLSAAEVAWLLEHAPGEVAVVRPADEDALAAA